MDSKREVVDYLKNNLGYCGCASENVITILLDTLEIIEARSLAVKNSDDEFSQKTKNLRELLRLNYDACDFGLGEWFIYLLENKGLIYHDKNVSDCWITPEGKHLLKGLRILGRNFIVKDLRES